MRQIVIVLALLFCFATPMTALADTQGTQGIEPVSTEALTQKVSEAERYFMDAASPIIKLVSKIMLVVIVFSLLGLFFTGAGVARNAFIALFFIGVGLAMFTAIPQLSDWFVRLGIWLAN